MDAETWHELARRIAGAPRIPVAAGARRAAVAAALRDGDDGLEVLLMRRAARPGDRWSGQISLPGGHVEPSDADVTAAAIRETREEVGLDLARDAVVIGELASLQAVARGGRIDLWITPVVFQYRGEGAFSLGPEADDAFWLPLDQVRRGDLDAEHPYEHEGGVVQMPSWRFGERVVWGLTHCILGDLLSALP